MNVHVDDILRAALTSTGPVESERPSEALTSDLPFCNDGQVEVGIWEVSPGRFTETTGTYDESMVMVSGRVSVEHDSGVFDLSPGTIWITPHDWPCTWTIHQTARKVYVIDHRPVAPGQPAYLANAYLHAMGAAGDGVLHSSQRMSVAVREVPEGPVVLPANDAHAYVVLAGTGERHVGSDREAILEPLSAGYLPAGGPSRLVATTSMRLALTSIHPMDA